MNMKLSTRVRYGIRAVIDLAEHYGKGPVQTKVIAKHQDISVKYLEQLMATLKSAGVVRSIRGSKGGYVLAKPPKKIRLSDVFVAFEGSVATVECVANADYCGRAADCVAREVWIEVQRAITGVLQSITLEDVVRRIEDGIGPDYQI